MPETLTEMEALIGAIGQGIQQRGFYLLFDDQLKLICGDYNPEDPSGKRDLINDFAKPHGWCVQIHGPRVMFFSLD